MTIRNDIEGSKRRLYMLIAGIVALVAGIGAFFPQYVEPQWATFLTASVATFVLVMSLLKDYQFIMADDANQRIRIRYYSILPVLRNYRAIEVAHGNLRGFRTEKRMLGLRTVLVVEATFKGRLATYPPINVTALSEKELSALLRLLTQYLPTKA